MAAKFGLTLILLLWLAVGSFAESMTTGPAAGADLRWRRVIVQVAISNSLRRAGTSIRPDADVEGAVKRSVDAWSAVANVDFAVSWTDKTILSPSGPAGDGVSLVTIAPTAENLVFFGGDAADASGRTRVFYNRRGEITEADVVLNPYQQFSTDGSFGTFDLESTLTHELGHLLGLQHSDAAGATMNEVQARNGLFNIAATGFRSLSADDIARIRSIYGARDADDCCGSVDGRLTGPKGLKNASVWLESAETNALAAQALTTADGSFSVKGLDAGRYRLFVQDAGGAGIDLGFVDVVRGRSTLVIRRLTVAPRPFELLLAGLGGQLSRLAVPVSGDRSYVVYIAGRGLDAGRIEVESTSSFVSVGDVSKRSDFGKELDVLAVEVEISAEAPAGEYSLAVRGADGRVVYMPGRLTVERSAVPGSAALPE